MTRLIPRILLVGLALIGAGAAGALLFEDQGAWSESDQGTTFLMRLCESSTPNENACAEVVDSRFGSFDFYLGTRRIFVPTSFVGLVYFLNLAIWFTLMGAPRAPSRWIRRVALLYLSSGIVVSALLTGVMALSLAKWCTLCVTAHVVNAALFLSVIALGRSRDRPAKPADYPIARTVGPANGQLAWIAAVTALATGVGLWLIYDANVEMRRQWRKANGFKRAIEAMQADADFVRREFYAGPVMECSADAPVRSIPAAPPNDNEPSLIVFRDLDSDASACFEKDWLETLRFFVHPALRVEYRHGPDALTPGSLGSTGEADAVRPIGVAAEAAAPQGEAAYERMCMLLMRYRKDAIGRDYLELARRAGLDVERYRVDLYGDAARQAVADDVQMAESLGVETTPTLVLDGRRVPHLCVKSPTFWRVVTTELVDAVTVAGVGPNVDADRSEATSR